MSPSERAARRANWSGEIVETGTAKGGLYAALSPSERFNALANLNRRVFGIISHQRSSRSEWPGQVFDIHDASES